MADISFLTTVGAIDNAISYKKERPRKYLGMSAIGDQCLRRLWLSYHTKIKEKFGGRMLRLFNTGDLIEARIRRDLRLAGFPVSGVQKTFKDFGGRFKGHSDGILMEGCVESSAEHILEAKSCNDKNFKMFVKNGVAAHPIYGPKYIGQAQCYMGYSGCKRTLFIVENKNTSERYQERVKFSQAEFFLLRNKAQGIIDAPYPPRGVGPKGIGTPDWFACKYCTFNNDDYCRKDWTNG